MLIVEVGYLTYGQDAANVLYHVVTQRHQAHRSMVFTSNKHPLSGTHSVLPLGLFRALADPNGIALVA